ncbi:MAG: hypothetical protein LBQ97_05865 [Fusobacteriaceae bacterium]|jgi:hypothetical protein|nr:hypothetical protein [Fusobacteriaceae bacterium]
MAKIIVENGELSYSSLFRKERYRASDIRWAYLQVEGVNFRLCCGKGYSEIYRIILRTAEERVELNADTKEQALGVLDALKQANPDLVIRYNKDWENVFNSDFQEFQRISHP